MDAKLNHSDLSALLAKAAGMSLAKAELLTKSIFDIIIEGIEQDGVVKINGLGTFKLTDVASRSSVNVNTGEKFEIKGHKKLVFTPADTLKDCVNQPFAMFEPVEVDETYNDDTDDDSNELPGDDNNELPGEENVASDDVQPEENEVVVEETEPATEVVKNGEPVAEETAVEETSVEEVEPAVAETETVAETVAEAEQPEEQPAEETEEAVAQHVEAVAEPVVEQPKRPEPVMVHVPKKEKKPFAVPEKKKSKNHKWIYVVLAVLFVLAALATLYQFYITPAENDSVKVDTVTKTEYKTDESVDKSSTSAVEHKPDAVTGATVDATSGATPQDKELVEKEVAIDAIVAEQAEPEEYRFVITDELASLDLKNITVADTAMYEMFDMLTEHKVAPHETLTRIALKYYGDKKLWPYIVKYNSLARPDDLRKGMKILIPKLKPRN